MLPLATTLATTTASSVVLADVPPARGRSGVHDVAYIVGVVGFVALFGWLIVRGVRGSKAERGAPPDNSEPPAR